MPIDKFSADMVELQSGKSVADEIGSLKTFVTPEDYGAKGSGTVDDSDAVQQAFDSGKNVFLPKQYLIEKPVFLNQRGIKIYGNARKHEYTNYNLKISGNGSIDVLERNITFQSVGIHGDTTNPPQRMILFGRRKSDNWMPMNCSLIDCVFTGRATDYAIIFSQAELNLIHNMYMAIGSKKGAILYTMNLDGYYTSPFFENQNTTVSCTENTIRDSYIAFYPYEGGALKGAITHDMVSNAKNVYDNLYFYVYSSLDIYADCLNVKLPNQKLLDREFTLRDAYVEGDKVRRFLHVYNDLTNSQKSEFSCEISNCVPKYNYDPTSEETIFVQNSKMMQSILMSNKINNYTMGSKVGNKVTIDEVSDSIICVPVHSHADSNISTAYQSIIVGTSITVTNNNGSMFMKNGTFEFGTPSSATVAKYGNFKGFASYGYNSSFQKYFKLEDDVQLVIPSRASSASTSVYDNYTVQVSRDSKMINFYLDGVRTQFQMVLTENSNVPFPVVGLMRFNTTKGKPEWWNSTAWIENCRWVGVPSTSTSPGQPGDIASDANYLYVCYASNLWNRFAKSTW